MSTSMRLTNVQVASRASVENKTTSQSTRMMYRINSTASTVGSKRSSYLGSLIFRHAAIVQRSAPRQSICQPAQASFLGVGAPEAILVGVVALVLFGPKGLAQAAKSLGGTIRAFAPTLRELTAVSAELKSTLEDEIGINDIRNELSRPPVPQPLPRRDLEDEEDSLSDIASSINDDPDIERKRAESAKLAWGDALPQSQQEQQQKSSGGSLQNMSLEELEAELQRRKAAQGSVPENLNSSE